MGCERSDEKELTYLCWETWLALAVGVGDGSREEFLALQEAWLFGISRAFGFLVYSSYSVP